MCDQYDCSCPICVCGMFMAWWVIFFLLTLYFVIAGDTYSQGKFTGQYTGILLPKGAILNTTIVDWSIEPVNQGYSGGTPGDNTYRSGNNLETLGYLFGGLFACICVCCSGYGLTQTPQYIACSNYIYYQCGTARACSKTLPVLLHRLEDMVQCLLLDKERARRHSA